MSGYTKSYRNKWSNPVFRNLLEAGIWSWLCDTAAWEEKNVRFNGKFITLQRGQVPVSERFIADSFCIGRQVVRTFLSNLLANHMVTQQVTQGATILTICNYNKYQSLEVEANPPDFENQPAYPTKYKEINNPPKCTPKGVLKGPPKGGTQQQGELKKSNPSRLSFADLPQEWADWAHAAMGWEAEVTADIWANFRDYWQQKAGKTAQKSDWLATWRTWCRKEAPRLRHAQKPPFQQERQIVENTDVCSCGEHRGLGVWSPQKRAQTYARFRSKWPEKYTAECKQYLESYEAAHGPVTPTAVQNQRSEAHG